jgi:hypothetical protein
LPDDSPVPPDSPQVGLYGRLGKRWVFLGNRKNDGTVIGTTAAPCEIKLAADIKGPSVRLESLQNGDQLAYSREPVAFTIEDQGSGVDPSSIELYVDGKLVKTDYEPATSRLVWTPDNDLSPGEHSITVSALDRSQNKSNVIQSKIVAPDKYGFPDTMIPYPNPARYYSRLRFSLTQPDVTESVTIRIYDTSGHRVRTIEYRGPFSYKDNEVEWDLTDSRGRTVSNGVYMFRAKARSLTGSSDTCKGKIAVLR